MAIDEDVDVVIIGGGVCGVLAAQRLQDEGFKYKLVEKLDDFGGVWAYRANHYSHLQAHAALYQWHRDYKLDPYPFRKCSSATVLQKLRNFADDFGVRQHAIFGAEVKNIRYEQGRYTTLYQPVGGTERAEIRSTALMVCSGILGKQHAPEQRSVPTMVSYTGKCMFAGRENDAENYLQDVVILGSGAFGLEAMEAAHRGGAKSITLLTKPRESLYQKSGIEHMAPASNTPQNFTGQCNDAFFQYAKQGIAEFIVSDIKGINGTAVELVGGRRLNADILVIALGHEIQTRPEFLEGLQIGLTADLHNFAFLGSNPLIGMASDWVWFNVPHGPQKQINSFISSMKACREGKAKAIKEALAATPFLGCKGEPLNSQYSSGLQQRRHAYWRTCSAGKSRAQKAILACRLKAEEWAVWLLCAAMYGYESYALHGWLNRQQRQQ